jgi:hypothetical protein
MILMKHCGGNDGSCLTFYQHEDPKIFAHLVDWLYGAVDELPRKFLRDSRSTLDCFKLYTMADRYSLPKLKVTVLGFLKPYRWTGTPFMPKIRDVQHVYENTPSSNDEPARKFLVNATLYYIFALYPPQPDILPGLAKCNLEFSSDVMLAARSHILSEAADCDIQKCSIHSNNRAGRYVGHGWA